MGGWLYDIEGWVVGWNGGRDSEERSVCWVAEIE